MEWPETFWWVLVAVAGLVSIFMAVHLAWRLRGDWRIRRAGPRRLGTTRHRIWREPSRADAADLRYGPGGEEGAPAPPFRFIEEHFAGSQPCVAVRDARDRLWRVKWGHEAKPEAFAVRFAWGSNLVSRGRWDAAGFDAQTPQFVTGVRDGWVNFGYQGQRTQEIARDITVAHVEWFYTYASRLKEPALRQALLGCGATDEDADRFARSLVERIRQLGAACSKVGLPRRSGLRLAPLAQARPLRFVSLAQGKPVSKAG